MKLEWSQLENTNKLKIAVLGGGSFGTAIANMVTENNYSVEYAGQLLITALWTGRILPQISGACAYFADRYFQRLLTLYRYPAAGLVSLADLATDCFSSFIGKAAVYVEPRSTKRI